LGIGLRAAVFPGDAFRRWPASHFHGGVRAAGQHCVSADFQPGHPSAAVPGTGNFGENLGNFGQTSENSLEESKKICKNTKKYLPKNATLVYNKR
jgi:hypothetical protein